MRPFTKHTGLVALMDRSNVDTDQIIPKQFLKRIERTAFGEFLFFDRRYRDDGTDKPDFELPRPAPLPRGQHPRCPQELRLRLQPRARPCPRAVRFPRDPCGKLRRHLLQQLLQKRHAADPLGEAVIDDLFTRVAASPGCELTVDLQTSARSPAPRLKIAFEVDDFRCHCLLNGLDDIGLTPRTKTRSRPTKKPNPPSADNRVGLPRASSAHHPPITAWACPRGSPRQPVSIAAWVAPRLSRQPVSITAWACPQRLGRRRVQIAVTPESTSQTTTSGLGKPASERIAADVFDRGQDVIFVVEVHEPTAASPRSGRPTELGQWMNPPG